MAISVLSGVRVISKFTKDGSNKDGKPIVYYNLKVADVENFDSQIIGVNKEVFDKAEEGKDLILKGKVGGLKEKYWYFDSVSDSK